jgi:hypothetical protein
MATKKKIVKEEVVTPRTLLIQATDGEYKVTIPAGARITFGPTIPFAPKMQGGFHNPGADRGYSLRVYTTAKNDSLIAVFAGVGSFRDITIPHAKLVIREAGKSVWKSDEEGYKVEQEVKREQHFEEFKLLNS